MQSVYERHTILNNFYIYIVFVFFCRNTLKQLLIVIENRCTQINLYAYVYYNEYKMKLCVVFCIYDVEFV